jgi:TusA-related sulfurtransferase
MAEHRLDCTGEACPIPLLKAEKKLGQLEVGDVLIVETDHSCAVKNIPEWARKHGHIVDLEEIDEGRWEIIIEKTK